jgi:hypothetical protein
MRTEGSCNWLRIIPVAGFDAISIEPTGCITIEVVSSSPVVKLI